jgi:hypothetical protein
VDYPVASQCFGVLAADVNGDGYTDIVAPGWTESNLSLLLGNGDGTFGPYLTYGTGYGPMGVTIGAFVDACGRDLAAANAMQNTVSVLANGCT